MIQPTKTRFRLRNKKTKWIRSTKGEFHKYNTRNCFEEADREVTNNKFIAQHPLMLDITMVMWREAVLVLKIFNI